MKRSGGLTSLGPCSTAEAKEHEPVAEKDPPNHFPLSSSFHREVVVVAARGTFTGSIRFGPIFGRSKRAFCFLVATS